MEMIEKDKDYLTKEQYDEVKDALDKAQDSTEPFLVVDGDGKNLSVIGDANDTKKKKRYYDVVFRFPDFIEFDKINADNIELLEEEKRGVVIYRKVRFKNVFLAPRDDIKMVKAINELMPFYNKLEEDGGINELSDAEIQEMIANFNEEIIEKMYFVVKSFLCLGDGFENLIIIRSLVRTFCELVADFPYVFNEADVFFA